jgi:hypothetical protein
LATVPPLFNLAANSMELAGTARPKPALSPITIEALPTPAIPAWLPMHTYF